MSRSTVVLRSEFAAVILSVDHAGNDDRLRVDDVESGACAFLDAFVLRALAVLPPQALESLCQATVPVEATATDS